MKITIKYTTRLEINMMINNETIIKDNNPLIREKSHPVELPLSKEDEQLLRDMYQYVEDSIDEEKAKELDLTLLLVLVPFKLV